MTHFNFILDMEYEGDTEQRRDVECTQLMTNLKKIYMHPHIKVNDLL